jgi:hypothetical protein
MVLTTIIRQRNGTLYSGTEHYSAQYNDSQHNDT